MNPQEETIQIDKATYLRLLEAEAKQKAIRDKWREAGKRYNEKPENAETIREAQRIRNQRYSERMRADPEMQEQRRLADAITYARRRLDEVGYLSDRANKGAIAALGLIRDQTTMRWVRPPI